MPTNCIIEFSNPNGVFYSGQELSGNIRIVTDIEKTIKAISITIVGKGITIVGKGKFAWFNEYYTYKAEEIFLSSCTYLVGSADGLDLTFNPGTYHYQFKSLLPSNLPTTLVGKNGGIQYEVIVNIDQVSHCNESFKRGFVVIHVLDLNIDPKYREPVIRNKTKPMCLFCCNSGNLDVKLTLPAIGFVKGQSIDFKIIIDNESNYNVKNVDAYLLKVIRFTSTLPRKRIFSFGQVIQKKSFGNTLKLSKKEIQDTLIVPNLRPSTINSSCQCIQVEYYFVVAVEHECCLFRFDLKLCTKIFIGYVPI